jgi:hypothetical protein
MQFKPFEPGIEVFGASIGAIVDAFKLFPSVALKKLVSYGIGTLKGSEVVIDRDAWYSLDKWLAAYESIATTVGNRALQQIGQHIPKHAPFPPTINDIHSAMASMNAAYHMNHRKNGKVMFDPATGTVLKGIGSYGYAPVSGEKKIISVCENPYPCDFDRGIITALANRFERVSRVSHDDSAPCRKNGADSCKYIITW